MNEEEKMVQIYEPTEEFPIKPKSQILDLNQKTETAMGDVFDLYGMASSVHSKMTTMSRDYTLAQYQSGIINEKFPKFIREQRKIVRILMSHMVIPVETLETKYNKESAIKIHNAMTKNFDDVQKLLLGEIDEMVIISRAGKGEVIKAMLMHGRTREEQQEYEDATGNRNILGKLKEREK